MQNTQKKIRNQISQVLPRVSKFIPDPSSHYWRYPSLVLTRPTSTKPLSHQIGNPSSTHRTLLSMWERLETFRQYCWRSYLFWKHVISACLLILEVFCLCNILNKRFSSEFQTMVPRSLTIARDNFPGQYLDKVTMLSGEHFSMIIFSL